jgi:NADH-quinone oxidoreductase subunit L
MTVPLMLLAAFAALAGYLGLPSFAFPNWFKEWLAPALAQVPTLHPPLWVEWLLVLASIVVAAAGLFAGWWIYERGKGAIAAKAGGGSLGRFAEGGLGFDAAYRAAAVGPAEGVAGGLAVADRDLLDRGIAAGVTASSLIGRAVAAWQSGYVRLYALAMFLGLAALAVVAAVVGGRP